MIRNQQPGRHSSIQFFQLVRMKVIAVFLALVAFVSTLPWEPEPRQDQWWQDTHRRHVENTINNPNIRVLFYGDSITDAWANEGRNVFEQYYAPLGTANYGVPADFTEHNLWRIQNGQLERLNPAVCVIKIGTNNIGPNDDASIARGIEANVAELRRILPNMKVLLLGILPRSDESMTAHTANINNIIRNLDNGNTVRFLDMRDHFYRNGDFVRELYTDLLHLTEAGYRKWAEVMDPLFREMLGNKSDWPLEFLKA